VPADSLCVVAVDACTLQNFAVVDALSVIEQRYGGRVIWTEAVAHEVRRGLPAEPLLQRVLDCQDAWLGQPIEFRQPRQLIAIDLIRRGLGGTDNEPLQHLGEAQSIYAVEEADVRDRLLISDDRPCADFAMRRPSGVRVLDAADILAEAFAMGDLVCPAPYGYLLAIDAYPRPVRVPRHEDVC